MFSMEHFMSKHKIKWITLISLVALFALVFGFALHSAIPSRKAQAISYATTSIFSEGTGADVGSAEVTEGETKANYIGFSFRDGGSVYYRRDLALKWYEAAKQESDDKDDDDKKNDGSNDDGVDKQSLTEDKLSNPAVTRYFGMRFSFQSFAFEKFSITFESAEENITKEGKSKNSLLFKVEEGALKLAVVNAESQKLEGDELDALYITLIEDVSKLTASKDYKDISVAFTEEGAVGEFKLQIKYGDELVALGENDSFTNIGGYFMEYRSSTSTTPNTPITFKADIPNATSAESEVKLIAVKELNGQSFKLNDSGLVEDTEPPALVLNEKVYAYTLGQRFSLTWEAIDVCDDSVSVTRSYYMAKLADKDEDDPSNGVYYKKPTTDDNDYKTLTTSTFFMPTSDGGDLDAEPEEYVSIRFRLNDGRTDSKGKTVEYYVYLTWYAADDSVVTSLPLKVEEGKEQEWLDCIIVNREKGGPAYVGVTANPDAEEEQYRKNEVDEEVFVPAKEAYEKAVADAAKDLSAGNGAYFYLPSLRGLIESRYTDYRNLRFSIYYYKPGVAEGGSVSSATSLRYNNLRFEIAQEGWYKFRVIASDASSNAMKMYLDGSLVTVSGDNVWDIEEIPEFSFYANYTGATIEEQDAQRIGYLDSTYDVTPFTIVATPGYETEYTLYRLDQSKLPAGESVPDYDACWKNAEDYFKRYYKNGEGALVEINKYNPDVTEEDDNWDDTDNAYDWDPDSKLSFRPQEATYYFLQIVVWDAAIGGYSKTGYQVIRVDNPIDRVVARSNWIQNNIVSVVLFSISAVLAIVIIVLFVVKPSDKKLEEVDLEKLKGKKSNKK